MSAKSSRVALFGMFVVSLQQQQVSAFGGLPIANTRGTSTFLSKGFHRIPRSSSNESVCQHRNQNQLQQCHPFLSRKRSSSSSSSVLSMMPETADFASIGSSINIANAATSIGELFHFISYWTTVIVAVGFFNQLVLKNDASADESVSVDVNAEMDGDVIDNLSVVENQAAPLKQMETVAVDLPEIAVTEPEIVVTEPEIEVERPKSRDIDFDFEHVFDSHQEEIIIDTSIPYDAAARLAYDQQTDDSFSYDAYKQKYEEDAVNFVKAKQKKAAETVVESKEPVIVDVSVPYDAAARLAFEASIASGSVNMGYDEFKTKYEADAIALVRAKQTKIAIRNDEPSSSVESKISIDNNLEIQDQEKFIEIDGSTSVPKPTLTPTPIEKSKSAITSSTAKPLAKKESKVERVSMDQGYWLKPDVLVKVEMNEYKNF
jgi:hypothetical protein